MSTMVSMSHYVEKMKSLDNDIRFMAASDLTAELNKPGCVLDSVSQRQAVDAILKLIEDKNGEVQNLAVKCLCPLVARVNSGEVTCIVEQLSSHMLNNDDDQLRDVSGIALKAVITEIPIHSSIASNICHQLLVPLLNAVKQGSIALQLASLDLLYEVFARFGDLLATDHMTIVNVLLPELTNSRPVVRKRVIQCIGQVVRSVSDSVFGQVFEEVIKKLMTASRNKKKVDELRAVIQCVTTIAKSHGLGVDDVYLDAVYPTILQYARIEEQDELRETCIQAIETFVLRCPKGIGKRISEITSLCLEFIAYDPNYNYDIDEDADTTDGTTDEDDDDDDDFEDDEDEGGNYSDDEDMSWKVRRGASKCLNLIAATRTELLRELYRSVAPALAARFIEHEESVRIDFMTTFSTLVKQMRAVNKEVVSDAMETDDSPASLLRSQIPLLITKLRPSLKDKSAKIRSASFELLRELVLALPGALTEHLGLVIPRVAGAITDKSAGGNLRLDALALLGAILTSHPPAAIHPFASAITNPVIHALKDNFYKVVSDALRVTTSLIRVMRPLNTAEGASSMELFDFTPYLPPLYEAVLSRFNVLNVDQEVKERSILCMARLVHNIGDEMGAYLNTCLPIFIERLDNEVTRMSATKAIAIIAQSPLKIDISPILKRTIKLLSSFMCKSQRLLRLHSLLALKAIIENFAANIGDEHLFTVLQDMVPLIQDSDMHLAQLALSVISSALDSNPHAALPALGPQYGFLDSLLALVVSSLLQGSALEAVRSVFFILVDKSTALPSTETAGISFKHLLALLLKPIYSQSQAASSALVLPKLAFSSTAQCVASICRACPSECDNVIRQFKTDISNEKSCNSIKLCALLAIGEIGRHSDLSSHENIETVLLSVFVMTAEEIKSAAAFALGSIAIGNLEKYLPFILAEVDSQPKFQYLLLHALRETISGLSATNEGVEALRPHVEQVLTMLFAHCESKEEGTRTVVAECLGKLTIIDPATLLHALRERLSSPSPFVRSTVVTAVKFSISPKAPQVYALLKHSMGPFLKLIEDPDLSTRRVSLVTFNSCAHNSPGLIRDELAELLPSVYSETIVKQELIREVQMGPFKHVIDDGLDIRKAAYECMYTLLDTCLDRLDPFIFLDNVERGLIDHYDVRMLCHLMLVRLATLAPTTLQQRLDSLSEPLMATVLSQAKKNAVKQETEKNDELVRSALRTILTLARSCDHSAEAAPKFNAMLARIRGSPDLEAKLTAIEKDSCSSTGDAMDIS